MKKSTIILALSIMLTFAFAPSAFAMEEDVIINEVPAVEISAVETSYVAETTNDCAQVVNEQSIDIVSPVEQTVTDTYNENPVTDNLPLSKETSTDVITETKEVITDTVDEIPTINNSDIKDNAEEKDIAETLEDDTNDSSEPDTNKDENTEEKTENIQDDSSNEPVVEETIISYSEIPNSAEKSTEKDSVNYEITIVDQAGNSADFKGGTSTKLSDILISLGYDVPDGSDISYDPDTVNENVISLYASEEGIILSDNGPFNKAEKVLKVELNGKVIELSITDPVEIQGDVTSIDIVNAFNSAEDGNVILKSDVNVTDKQTVVIPEGNHELYLNGHKISFFGIMNSAVIKIPEQSTLKIYGGNVTDTSGNGTISVVQNDPTEGTSTIIEVCKGGNLELASGNLVIDSQFSATAIYNTGNTVMNGGTIEVGGSSNGTAIGVLNDVAYTEEMCFNYVYFTINNGHIITENKQLQYGIKNTNTHQRIFTTASVILNDGEIDVHGSSESDTVYGIYASSQASKINISGGKISATGGGKSIGVMLDKSNTSHEIRGGTIQGDSAGIYIEDTFVRIFTANITSQGYALYANSSTENNYSYIFIFDGNFQGNIEEGTNGIIYTFGGKYTANPEEYLYGEKTSWIIEKSESCYTVIPDEYYVLSYSAMGKMDAEGSSVVVEIQGIYKSLDEAVSSIPNYSDFSLILLQDTGTDGIAASRGFSLNLNGKVLYKNKNASADQSIITINSPDMYNGNILIQDSRPDVAHHFSIDGDGLWYLYKVDNGGNITYGGEIVYKKEYVSMYPVLEQAEIEIISREFEAYPSLADYPYREGLVVIDSESAYTFDEKTKRLTLPDTFIKDNDITAGKSIVAFIDGEETVFTIADNGSYDSEHPGNTIFQVTEGDYEINELRQGKKENLEEAVFYDNQYGTENENYLGGKWTYIVSISAGPESAVNKDIIIEKPDSDAYEIKVNGVSSYAEDTEIEIAEEDISDTLLTVTSTEKGTFNMVVRSSVGSFLQTIPIEFDQGSRDSAAVTLDTKPFTSVISAAAPAATATPSPAPVPTAVPTQTPAYNQYNYSYSSPVTTTAPATAVEEPSAFSTDVQTLTLNVGQTAQIATKGNDGGYIQVYSSDTEVAKIELIDGIGGAYTVEGTGEGTCTVTFESLNGTATVDIAVIY